MKCANCQGENRPQAEFCAWCGTSLAAQRSEAQDITIMSPAAAAQPAAAPAPADAGNPPASEPVTVPLAPDTVLAQRYRILELLASSPTHNRYRALDQAFCRACGNEANKAEDTYCVQCGAALDPRRIMVLDEELRNTPAAYDIHLVVDKREYYGNVEAVTAPPLAAPARPGLRVSWGLATDKGLQRDHNEDYLEGWIYSRGGDPLFALFVVADGLGGQDSGEVASKLTVDTLWEQVRAQLWDPITAGAQPEASQYPAVLRQAVINANNQVYKTRMERNSQMSSTVTTALLAGNTAHIANVGDSRTYVYGPQGLVRITKDHSLVQRLVDTGQIKPEEVYTHPRRNLVYQTIGDRVDVQVDLYERELKPDERLILCSDGLWEMVHDDGLLEVLLAEADPQLACNRLLKNANLAGGEDNISIIIVQIL